MAGLGVLMLAWLGWRAPQLAATVAGLRAGLSVDLAAPVQVAQAPPVAAAVPTGPPPMLARAAAPPPLVMARPLVIRGPAPAIPAVMMLPAQPTSTQPTSTPPTPTRPASAPPAPTPSPPTESQDPAFRLAEQAYGQLRAGNRREAAALLDAALAQDPGNAQWQADRRALGRRWQLGGFSLLRDGGPLPNAPGAGLPGAAASPVLGGGQMGGSVAYLVDPLARRPLAIVARANVAADSSGVRQETAQAAIGIRQTLLPGVTLSAERLIALGAATRGDWTLRLAAGGTRGRLDAYGEAGVLGNGTLYGGAQATARLLQIGPATLAAGSWASVQTGTPDVWRVDVGPSVTADWRGLRFQADWRERVGGNAAPGSGPVLTVSAGF
jgi:hypothetical protein